MVFDGALALAVVVASELAASLTGSENSCWDMILNDWIGE